MTTCPGAEKANECSNFACRSHGCQGGGQPHHPAATRAAIAKTAAHVEKETLAVDVNIPEHDARVTTALFTHTRKLLIEREGGRCFICGRTQAETGPLEAHHHPIERCFAAEIDWALVAIDCRAGMWGKYAQAFDWANFDPAHWETFVDDMTVNGLLLCKDHHTAADDGVHTAPGPIWLAQRYAKEGTKFNSREVIHHDQVAA